MTHDTSTHIHRPDPPAAWQIERKARLARIAEAGKRQAEKVAALQAQQINIEQIEALEKVVQVQEIQPEPEPVAPPPPRPLPPIRGDVSRIIAIQHAVAHHFGVNRSDLTGKSHLAKFVWPRQIAFYLSRKMTNRSFGDIASKFGGRDHTTVHFGFHKIAGLLATNSALALAIAEITEMLERAT